MKRIINLTIWLVFLAWAAYAQDAVRTETASNKYHKVSLATLGDTLFTKDTTHVSGSAIKFVGTEGFAVGVLVGNPVASDTLIVKNGTDTVAFIKQGTSPVPNFYFINAHLDTNCVVIQKLSSKSTFIWRTRF